MISFQCDTLDEARAVINAVAALGKSPHACSKQYIEPTELTQEARNEQSRQWINAIPVKQNGVLDIRPVEVEPRKNVSPGEPSITKIGSGTKESLLAHLKAGGQPTRAKFEEHLKLLWKRGEIKFDGEQFYV